MKKVLKAFFLVFMLVIALTVAVILIRTMTVSSKQMFVTPVPPMPVDRSMAAEHLSQVIKFKTISYLEPEKFNKDEFRGLQSYLLEAYPHAHSVLEREIVAEISLLYIWKGTDTTLKPILLMAHQDVVPVEPGTEDDWTHPAFSGAIAEGFIWGRGSLDVKLGITGTLEAVEYLINEGFQPQRTVLLAFGHDEEVGGKGAAAIAALLKSHDISLEYVIDEGGFIYSGDELGISNPVAMIGIAEKGHLSLELSVLTKGGHSSMPPKHTAVGIISTAIHKLERRPFPTGVKDATRTMFSFTCTEMPFLRRMLFANLWLFSPIVKSYLSSMPETNAMIWTTTAATMFTGSVKDNVLPQKAQAVVNFRIMPGETSESVTENVAKTINNPDIKIKPISPGVNPSKISDIESEAFQVLHKTTKQLFPDVIITPYLVMAYTDSRHYRELTDNIFRFIPIPLTAEDTSRVHGTDERLSIDDYTAYIQFLVQLIRNSQYRSQ